MVFYAVKPEIESSLLLEHAVLLHTNIYIKVSQLSIMGKIGGDADFRHFPGYSP